MGFFDKKIYEWRKHMPNILQNVALSKIVHSEDNILSFSFLNTFDGRLRKKLSCNNVWKMCFETNIEADDEFPCFIGDVKMLKLENELIEEAFKYFNYGFNKIPNSKEYILLSICGGDTDIDILCGNIELLDEE